MSQAPTENPKVRAMIYAVVSAAVLAAGVIGLSGADEIDANKVADSVVSLVAIASLLLARANVKR